MGTQQSVVFDTEIMSKRSSSTGSLWSYRSRADRRTRAGSGSDSGSIAVSTTDGYGWFEEIESFPIHINGKDGPKALERAFSLPLPVTEPPRHVLESSLQSQRLWYETAGRRPCQPKHEREYFERLWTNNFEMSEIPGASDHAQGLSEEIYTVAGEVSESKSNPEGKQEKPEVEGHVEVLFHGTGCFSNAVSKSFLYQGFPNMTIQVPSFMISKDKSTGEIHASFHVVVCFSGVTLGVWRRHSDFKELAGKLEQAAGDPASFDNDGGEKTDELLFKNSLLSWECLIHKQRWFRCLDKDYLALKCFLLERFCHDVLFESPSPAILADFLGLTE